MFKNKNNKPCDENEVQIKSNKETKQEKSFKKDVELCLEVEMDDEVREIIASPDKCASTLLDVTVIKPKDLDQIYTTQRKTLNGEEVRKLIASMELEKTDKEKLLDQILAKDETFITIQKHNSNNPKSAGDYIKNKFSQKYEKETNQSKQKRHIHYIHHDDSSSLFEQIQKICTTDDTNSDDFSNYKKRFCAHHCAHERIKQIYTTPRTYNDIKSIFTCKNKKYDEGNEKLDKPCLCQNCAIVGVLTDSQKRPFITENLYDPRELLATPKKEKESRSKGKKKSVYFKDYDHIECQYYFKHLSARIKDLEERLAIQEEKSVPRDYFKRIITKLVTHISKITSYGSQVRLINHTQKYRDSHRYKEKDYDNTTKNYYVNSLLVDSKSTKFPAEKEDCHPKQNEATPSRQTQQHYEGLWKWGEEILKPGIDLKNKIIVLLEDTIHNLKRPKSNVSSKDNANYKHPFNEVPTKHCKFVDEVPVKDFQNKKDHIGKEYKLHNISYPSNSESSFPKQKNNKIAKNNEQKNKRTIMSKIFNKKDFVYDEPLNVSYINPDVSKWQDDSQISFKFDSSDVESLKKMEETKLNNAYKIEFMKTLSNTKEVDKLKLWESIWNQAKANGQSRQDKVTIQIPDKTSAKKQCIVEIEYSIAELESLLIGKGISQKNHSSNKHSSKK